MVYRITENIISIDGFMVIRNGLLWKSPTNKVVGEERLNKLSLFLIKENIAFKDKFENYVDYLINKLLYNGKH